MAGWIFFNASFSHGGSVGHSRAAILEGIDRFGSIAAAARAVNLTYPSVWITVQRLNKEFPQPLVTIHRSGRASGAILTPFGKGVLAHFRELEKFINRSKQLRAFDLAAGDDPDVSPPVPRWAQIIDPATLPAAKKPKRSSPASATQKRKPAGKQVAKKPVAKKKLAKAKTKSSRSK